MDERPMSRPRLVTLAEGASYVHDEEALWWCRQALRAAAAVRAQLAAQAAEIRGADSLELALRRLPDDRPTLNALSAEADLGTCAPERHLRPRSGALARGRKLLERRRRELLAWEGLAPQLPSVPVVRTFGRLLELEYTASFYLPLALGLCQAAGPWPRCYLAHCAVALLEAVPPDPLPRWCERCGALACVLHSLQLDPLRRERQCRTCALERGVWHV